jgi:hypothetical protein
MHPTPTRLALAGSILVMGSVGTVSAVSLQSAPAPLARVPGTPQALAAHRVAPAPRLDAAPSSPTDLAPIAPALTSPPASRPGPVLDARHLVDLATSPLPGGVVRVPVSGLDRPARRVITHVTTRRPVKRVVRDVEDTRFGGHRKTAAKSIGRRFDAEMAWRAFDGYASAARGYPGMGSAWADDYVGRHRAE